MTDKRTGRILRSLSGFYDVALPEGIVTCRGRGILRKEGYDVKNADFFKIGIPFTLSAIVPAYILIWILFGA